MTETQSNRWPAAIIALALVFLAALGGSLYWGITRASRVSDPAYYRQGINYGGRLQAERTTQDWLFEMDRNGPELILRLTDAAGAPLMDLEGTLTVQAPDGTDGSRHDLVPRQRPGEYQVLLPALPPGGVKATLYLHREGAVLRRSLLLVP